MIDLKLKRVFTILPQSEATNSDVLSRSSTRGRYPSLLVIDVKWVIKMNWVIELKLVIKYFCIQSFWF